MSDSEHLDKSCSRLSMYCQLSEIVHIDLSFLYAMRCKYVHFLKNASKNDLIKKLTMAKFRAKEAIPENSGIDSLSISRIYFLGWK
ncbi:hypothetical protein Xmau_03413 [Xenorhabdus mauleonii]|uniref:Uncharacterized protein n=1 Tax=Xenorhabdus mauleonii TaxID=351675 RepID=A0A1I3QXD6_9GAMM|nr:hypothetical protein Xmau_03413 [Xenorhabdus mauleonii]SFJ38139.1 hypothetical protein SAMN05421680_10846 [Xenorhabdus mauleonii]